MTSVTIGKALDYIISIHMPHTWHDVSPTVSPAQAKKFQSTCHIRGMTQRIAAQDSSRQNFNPHATYVA